MPTLIAPRVHDLGGFYVRRAVPSLKARSVGPFVFVDHMGPHLFQPGQGIDVRPHPHIGLATVTYLWEGRMRHRDSIGSVQDIAPGDVNWMTAGAGIVHSERTPEAEREHAHPVHGLQTWVALPKSFEETDPAFFHHPAATLPRIQGQDRDIAIVAGRSFGQESPVAVFADTLYAAIDLQPGASLVIPAEHAERALYVLAGESRIDGSDMPTQQLILLDAGVTHRLEAISFVRAMLLGGEPLDAPRHMFWNFVSSSPERIEQAKDDWREQRFASVPGETEFIPLP